MVKIKGNTKIAMLAFSWYVPSFISGKVLAPINSETIIQKIYMETRRSNFLTLNTRGIIA